MAVKSPCIDVCAFDGKTKLCVGCFRALDETRARKKMADHRRHQVTNDLRGDRPSCTANRQRCRPSNRERRIPESMGCAATTSFW